MPEKFTEAITKEEDWYVAHGVELGVVSQGKTIEEAKANLKEAVELYLESFGEGNAHEMVRP
jgi:predicted RNase H-like HicB family nuclease